MIEIDGSFGEGGGQILRTALSLSCLLETPFRIFNIRKGRKKPGLMPQHVTCIKAVQAISDASVEGDFKGSYELTFSPGKTNSGSFFFDIGTAGSTMLVLQTLVPALMLTGRQSSVVLQGGTHVPFSPSFNYVSEIFAAIIARTGVNISLSIESYGFYPKGGGRVKAEISPARKLKPLDLSGRGRILRVRGQSAVGNLPLSIAERQRNAALGRTSLQLQDLAFPFDIGTAEIRTPGAGTFIFLKAETEHSIAGFTSIGERGKRAEAVGEEVAKEFIDYCKTAAALDQHMSDQIVLYLAMCKGESAFTTSCITEHLMTNLRVIGLFHHYDWSVEGDKGKPGKVIIKSRGK